MRFTRVLQFWRTSPVRMAAPVAPKEVPKATTGITGLKVDPDWRSTLTRLYQKTLNDVKLMPEDVYYRQAVEAITNYRLGLVQNSELSRDDIEAEMDLQVEQMIEIAKDELELIPKYASWREWDQPDTPVDDEDFHDLYEQMIEVDPHKMAANNIEWPQPEGRDSAFEMYVQTQEQKEERERQAAEAAKAEEQKAK